MELFGFSSLGNYWLWIDAGGFFFSVMQPQVTPPCFKGLPHPCSHGWPLLNATGHTTDKVMSRGNGPTGKKNSIDRGGSDQNESYTCMSKNKCHKTISLRIRDLVLSSGISLLHRHSDSVYQIRFGQVVMILWTPTFTLNTHFYHVVSEIMIQFLHLSNCTCKSFNLNLQLSTLMEN